MNLGTGIRIDNIFGYATFDIVEEHFGYLSPVGIIIAASLGSVALILALLAPLWFPGLSKRLLTHTHTRWIASSQFGWILPFACAFLLLPISGLFSTSNFTFWLFLLFGWGFSAILLYFGSLIDKITSQP
ncbi:MAG: hypothetical protein HDR88_16090 [Bacteroides sp.]|nr:hypothetical protein [Bacteroides sp.]